MTRFEVVPPRPVCSIRARRSCRASVIPPESVTSEGEQSGPMNDASPRF
jgi:hypothetical protein